MSLGSIRADRLQVVAEPEQVVQHRFGSHRIALHDAVLQRSRAADPGVAAVLSSMPATGMAEQIAWFRGTMITLSARGSAC